LHPLLHAGLSRRTDNRNSQGKECLTSDICMTKCGAATCSGRHGNRSKPIRVRRVTNRNIRWAGLILRPLKADENGTPCAGTDRRGPLQPVHQHLH
jgi:hypothetical protein